MKRIVLLGLTLLFLTSICAVLVTADDGPPPPPPPSPPKMTIEP